MWRRHSCRPRPDSSGRLPGGITAATVVLPPTSSRASSRPRLFPSTARAPPPPRPPRGPPCRAESPPPPWSCRPPVHAPLRDPGFSRPAPAHHPALDPHLTPVRGQQPRDHGNGGGFSGAVRAQQAHHFPWSRPWPAVFSATRGVILGRREPEAPILKTCLLGLLIACLCASAADLPKLPPETMGLIDQARSLPPEFSADTLLTLAASRVITERAWK